MARSEASRGTSTPRSDYHRFGHAVAVRAGGSLSGFSNAVAYAGTANGGKDLRVVAYRHMPSVPVAYLVSKTNRVGVDSVNPPSATTLDKAAKNLLAKK